MPDLINSDMFKWSLSGEDIVATFQHILRGESLEIIEKTETDATGQPYTKQVAKWSKTNESEALLNSRGEKELTNTLYTFLNRNTYLSNFKESRALKIARDLLLAVNRDLFFYSDDFAMADRSYNFIITQLQTLLLAAIYRPVDEGERKFYKATVQEIRQVLSSTKDGREQSGALFGTPQNR